MSQWQELLLEFQDQTFEGAELKHKPDWQRDTPGAMLILIEWAYRRGQSDLEQQREIYEAGFS